MKNSKSATSLVFKQEHTKHEHNMRATNKWAAAACTVDAPSTWEVKCRHGTENDLKGQGACLSRSRLIYVQTTQVTVMLPISPWHIVQTFPNNWWEFGMKLKARPTYQRLPSGINILQKVRHGWRLLVSNVKSWCNILNISTFCQFISASQVKTEPKLSRVASAWEIKGTYSLPCQ